MLETFRTLYGSAEGVRRFRAPGRVNLIGEHTDYNLGFVLPVALDMATTVAAAPSGDGMVRIYSEQRQEMRQWKVEEIAGLAPVHDWPDYPIGVARELILAGFPIQPANLLVASTVPEGSGLSSSAALEVSSALAFLHGRALHSMELALLCQRAERNFVGMPCGIMDQYISVFGQRNCAVEIDCRSLGHRTVTLPEGITFVAVNTMVKHALASSAYRERVAECAAAVAGVRERFPDVKSLRDVSPEQLAAVAPQLSGVVARRARHVVTEDVRVGRFVDASAANGAVDARIAHQPARRLSGELRRAGFPGRNRGGDRGCLRFAHDGRRIRRMHGHAASRGCRQSFRGTNCGRVPGQIRHYPACLRMPAFGRRRRAVKRRLPCRPG